MTAEKRTVHFIASDTQIKKKSSAGRLLSIITRIFVLKTLHYYFNIKDGSLPPFHC
jgi:hypothetical protein